MSPAVPDYKVNVPKIPDMTIKPVKHDLNIESPKLESLNIKVQDPKLQSPRLKSPKFKMPSFKIPSFSTTKTKVKVPD